MAKVYIVRNKIFILDNVVVTLEYLVVHIVVVNHIIKVSVVLAFIITYILQQYRTKLLTSLVVMNIKMDKIFLMDQI